MADLIVSSNVTQRNTPSLSAKEYKVQKGDCLWNVAKKNLSDNPYGAPTDSEITTEMRRLAKLNGTDVKSLGGKFYEGKEIKMYESSPSENVSDKPAVKEAPKTKEVKPVVPKKPAEVTVATSSSPAEKAKGLESYFTDKKNYDDTLAGKHVKDFTYTEKLQGKTGEEKKQDYKTKALEFAHADNAITDSNQDGKVEFNEFNTRERSAYEKMFGKVEDKDKDMMTGVARTAFDNIDQNSDGNLDDKEKAASIALIDNADGKIDGKISYEGYIGASASLGEKDGKSNLKTFYDDLFK